MLAETLVSEWTPGTASAPVGSAVACFSCPPPFKLGGGGGGSGHESVGESHNTEGGSFCHLPSIVQPIDPNQHPRGHRVEVPGNNKVWTLSEKNLWYKSLEDSGLPSVVPFAKTGKVPTFGPYNAMDAERSPVEGGMVAYLTGSADSLRSAGESTFSYSWREMKFDKIAEDIMVGCREKLMFGPGNFEACISECLDYLQRQVNNPDTKNAVRLVICRIAEYNTESSETQPPKTPTSANSIHHRLGITQEQLLTLSIKVRELFFKKES